MMGKPRSYYAFEMLYWTGIRDGELLALTPEDFDFENRRCGLIKRKMERGCKETGVPVIRIHDLRHSHVSICGRYSDKNGWCFLD